MVKVFKLNLMRSILQSIKLQSSEKSTILLVGTHLDSKSGGKAASSKALLEKIDQLRTQFSQIRLFIPVSCKSKRNVNVVFTQLVQLGKAQQGGIKSYPRAYMQVEDVMLAERTATHPTGDALREVQGRGLVLWDPSRRGD